MRIEDFVAVEDSEFAGRSLIGQVFGDAFCVVDLHRRTLTTAHNRMLLQRARSLVEQPDGISARTLAEALEQLGAQAQSVRQSDYDNALGGPVQRLDLHARPDYAEKAGCLD